MFEGFSNEKILDSMRYRESILLTAELNAIQQDR
jgi:hypothetical protein